MTSFQRDNLIGNIFTPPAHPSAVMAIIHGLGEHMMRYSPMAEAMAKEDIACMGIDLPGHGETVKMQNAKAGVCHDFSHMLNAVDTLLLEAKERYPGLPLYLFGHSMGGGIVLNYGLTRDMSEITGVIAQAPLLRPGKPVPRAMLKVLTLLRKIMPGFTAKNGLDTEQISSMAKEVEKYLNDPLVHNQLGAGLAVDMLKAGEWSLANAKKWSTPLLMMHSEEDKITCPISTESFATQAQNCRIQLFGNAAHEIHNDVTRADVYAELTRFISAQTAS